MLFAPLVFSRGFSVVREVILFGAHFLMEVFCSSGCARNGRTHAHELLQSVLTEVAFAHALDAYLTTGQASEAPVSQIHPLRLLFDVMSGRLSSKREYAPVLRECYAAPCPSSTPSTRPRCQHGVSARSRPYASWVRPGWTRLSTRSGRSAALLVVEIASVVRTACLLATGTRPVLRPISASHSHRS